MIFFNVTFDTYTPDSVEQGDTATRGFYLEGVSLREAVQAIGWGADEANSSHGRVRWITSHNVRENYATGEREDRSLHIPATVTDASAERIARLLGARA